MHVTSCPRPRLGQNMHPRPNRKAQSVVVIGRCGTLLLLLSITRWGTESSDCLLSLKDMGGCATTEVVGEHDEQDVVDERCGELIAAASQQQWSRVGELVSSGVNPSSVVLSTLARRVLVMPTVSGPSDEVVCGSLGGVFRQPENSRGSYAGGATNWTERR